MCSYLSSSLPLISRELHKIHRNCTCCIHAVFGSLVSQRVQIFMEMDLLSQSHSKVLHYDIRMVAKFDTREEPINIEAKKELQRFFWMPRSFLTESCTWVRHLAAFSQQQSFDPFSNSLHAALDYVLHLSHSHLAVSSLWVHMVVILTFQYLIESAFFFPRWKNIFVFSSVFLPIWQICYPNLEFIATGIAADT